MVRFTTNQTSFYQEIPTSNSYLSHFSIFTLISQDWVSWLLFCHNVYVSPIALNRQNENKKKKKWSEVKKKWHTHTRTGDFTFRWQKAAMVTRGRTETDFKGKHIMLHDIHTYNLIQFNYHPLLILTCKYIYIFIYV